METLIWILALIAVVVIVVLYVITSVSKYSNSVAGKFEKGKEKEKDPEG